MSSVQRDYVVFTINVGHDFSREPAGRYISDGPFSGERFRDEKLAPALQAHKSFRVELDDTEGYGSSFLEEAFGGLTRAPHHYDPDELVQRIKLETNDPSLIDEIQGYIKSENVA